jgi:hypothetical protein
LEAEDEQDRAGVTPESHKQKQRAWEVVKPIQAASTYLAKSFLISQSYVVAVHRLLYVSLL